MDLIFEGVTIDRIASFAGAGWISTLNHESRDHSMENCVIVVLLKAELDEVCGSDGSFPPPNLYFYIALRGK